MTAATAQAGYASAGEQRERLEVLCDQVGSIARELGDDGVADRAGTLGQRLRNEVFRVMVVGDFNRGKSTFVNALLGEPVLPVKAVPATAVITEIRFGERRAARLWREGSPTPEEVDPAELVNRITIDNSDRDRRSPYVRAEVTWPLTLCPRGVVLIDSPGLNEHLGRDETTLGYLLQADAVVFLQHAISPMSIAETAFLQGYLEPYDPFFVFTYFDAVDAAERDEVRANARRRIADLRGAERDEGRTFFIDGKAALRARVAGDSAGFEGSGVGALERSLEHYLATDRQKVKVMSPARGLRGLAVELIKKVPRELALLDVDAAELATRWEAAQGPLRSLELEAERINLDLGNQSQRLQQKVELLLAGFLETVAAEASAIADATTPDSKLSLVPWNVKERAEQVAKEIALATSGGIEQRITQWVASSLEPAIRTDLEAILERMNAWLDSFDAGLDKLRVSLTGISEAAAAGESQEETPVARLLAGVGGFLLGGVAGGLVGGRLGAKEALRTLIPTLLITMAWLFTPWGIPTLVGALVIQGVWAGNRGLDRLTGKMKAAIGREMTTQIRLQAPKLAQEAAAKFASETMVPIEEAVRTGLAGRLAEVTREVDAAQAAHRDGAQQVQRRRVELRQLEARLGEASQGLDDLIDDLGML